MTTTRLLAEAADRTPDRRALCGPEQPETTYAALAQRAGAFAAALRDRGARPGEPVILALPKGADAVAALYGIQAIRAAAVPVSPRIPPQRLALLSAALGARLGIGEARAAGSLSWLGAVPPGAAAPLPAEARGSDCAYILHTSGSTGAPKAVGLTHDNALAFLEPAVAYLGLTERDVLAAQAPLQFDLSVLDIYGAAMIGATAALIPAWVSAFPAALARALVEHRVTVINVVASVLTALADQGDWSALDLRAVRTVMSSGEPLPARTLDALRARLPGARLLNVYGQTEANSSLFHEIRPDDSVPLPLGEPLPGYTVALLDGDRPGEGELEIRGPAVAAGYIGRDDARFRRAGAGGWAYRTGDQVRRTASGALVFVGRRDRLVKIRGHRVELDEVELRLAAAPGVREAAVGWVSETGVLWAAVSLTGDDLDAVRAHLVAWLPPPARPTRWLVCSALPRTRTGKIDRRTLCEEVAAL